MKNISQLRYPSQLPPDFMILTPREYTSRTGASSGRRNGVEYTPILLPLPDLPQAVSSQGYGKLSGAFRGAMASAAGSVYGALANGGGGDFDVDNMVASIKANASDQFAPAAREFVAQGAAEIMGLGISGAALQTLGTGEITNPNIELLYQGPTTSRQFAMNWTLAPKSQEEADMCFEIVRQLKCHHLPSKNDNAPGMLQVPSVFDIDVFVNGKPAEYYQKYFTCVLEAFSVKQNSSGTHFTLPNGEPALSQINLMFREIKTTTANDFKDNI